MIHKRVHSKDTDLYQNNIQIKSKILYDKYVTSTLPNRIFAALAFREC